MKKVTDWTVVGKEREREILAERARMMSQESIREDSPIEVLNLLEFKLSGDHLAVETVYVEAVQTLRELTPLPGMPDHVLGIGYLRGRVFCLNNLSRLLGLPAKNLNERDSIIILRKPGMEFAVIVEEIIGIRSVGRRDVRRTDPGKDGNTDYIMGISGDGLIVLNGEALLDDPRLRVDQLNK